MYTNIDDRIAAFTFAFTPLASKVFKHKKRLRVENEEECQEEWLRSKKSKFSYTKPIVDKVNKAFNDFKSSKGFYILCRIIFGSLSINLESKMVTINVL